MISDLLFAATSHEPDPSPPLNGPRVRSGLDIWMWQQLPNAVGHYINLKDTRVLKSETTGEITLPTVLCRYVCQRNIRDTALQKEHTTDSHNLGSAATALYSALPPLS